MLYKRLAAAFLLLFSLSAHSVVYLQTPPAAGGAPSINGTFEFALNSAGTASQITVNVPSSSANGKFLVTILAADNGNATGCSENTTTDWTLRVNTEFAGQSSICAWTRQADGTEASSYTFDYDDADDMIIWMLVIDDASTTAAYDTVQSDIETGPTTSHVITQVTTGANNALVIAAIAFDGADGDPFSTSSSGWTEFDERDAPAGGTQGHKVSGAIYYATVDTAGTAPALTITSSASDGANSFMMSIIP